MMLGWLANRILKLISAVHLLGIRSFLPSASGEEFSYDRNVRVMAMRDWTWACL